MVSSLNLMVLWIITVCCCSGAVGHYCHLYYGVWNSSSFPKTAVIFSHFTGLICCVSVSVIKSVFFSSLWFAFALCWGCRLRKRKQLNSWHRLQWKDDGKFRESWLEGPHFLLLRVTFYHHLTIPLEVISYTVSPMKVGLSWQSHEAKSWQKDPVQARICVLNKTLVNMNSYLHKVYTHFIMRAPNAKLIEHQIHKLFAI